MQLTSKSLCRTLGSFSFQAFIGFYAPFVRFPAKLGNFAYRVGGEKAEKYSQI